MVNIQIKFSVRECLAIYTLAPIDADNFLACSQLN